MRVKTTVAEWTAFIADDWGSKDAYYDDACFQINGEEVDDVAEDLTLVTAVTILSGVVYPKGAQFGDSESIEVDLGAFFKSWRERQKYEFLAIKVPKEQSQKLLSVLAELGGGLLSK